MPVAEPDSLLGEFFGTIWTIVSFFFSHTAFLVSSFFLVLFHTILPMIFAGLIVQVGEHLGNVAVVRPNYTTCDIRYTNSSAKADGDEKHERNISYPLSCDPTRGRSF